MKTIISGPVDEATLARARAAGIIPTVYISNGLEAINLPPTAAAPLIFLIDKKQGDGAEFARDYTLCQNADAAIIKGFNQHLEIIARKYGLLVHWEYR